MNIKPISNGYYSNVKSSKKDDEKMVKANDLKFLGKTDNELKRLFGQKAAMKSKLDQFNQDEKIDDMQKKHLEMFDKLSKEADECNQLASNLREKKEELLKACGEDNEGELYKSITKEYDEMIGEYDKRAFKASNSAVAHNQSIEAIKQARLKSDPMVSVKKEADEMLEKVNDQIAAAIIEQVKENVDDKLGIEDEDKVLTNPEELIQKKKLTQEDLKGLAVDEQI